MKSLYEQLKDADKDIKKMDPIIWGPWENEDDEDVPVLRLRPIGIVASQ